ncbi:MAG: HAD family hydrolase [Nitrospirae bacterium]|nr:HAD family hydrolase [Magnetococcales bacterium]
MKSIDQFRRELTAIKNDINAKNYKKALVDLCQIADIDADFSVNHRLAKLFSRISGEDLGLKPIRVAIVPTSTVDNFIPIFRFYMARSGFLAEIQVSEFNTLHQTVLNSESWLYSFSPDIVWIFTGYRDIATHWLPGSTEKEVTSAIQTEVDHFVDLWQALAVHGTAIIMQNNADTPSDRVFGNFEGCISWGRQNYLRQFNLLLARRALEHHVQLVDLEHLSGQFGKRVWHDAPYWHHSKHAFHPDASALLALQGAQLIQATKGMAKKCLVLDLDNTLWGGVIGDDGLEGIQLGNGSAAGEAFSAFQQYVKMLQVRGIILAVCSKNEESNAKAPFLDHAEMVLKLEDIAVFVANWHNKGDNIREISEILEIGLDSMVFVDDNPVERQLVRQMLPMVSVPEMPMDPAHYVATVDKHAYFEAISFSVEDQARGQMYRQNSERKMIRKKYADMDGFLKDLQMVSVFGDLGPQTRGRASQLILKSNQFHLTTTRYTEAQLEQMMAHDEIFCRYYRLQDRFGDNGLISVVILKKIGKKLHVDTWVMSCRVLSRGMEDFIHNDMVDIAISQGCEALVGAYLPTKKNQLVSKLYERLGYYHLGEGDGVTHWIFSIGHDVQRKVTYIQSEIR